MSTLKIFYYFILFLFPHIGSTASTGDCVNLTTSCGGISNFEIRFPFRLRDRHPEHCGYPGFDLSCTKGNETVLELPRSGKFFVRNITYIDQEIEIYDPFGCLPRRLLDFNLYASPFRGKENSSFTLFNCSKDLPENIYVTTMGCLDDNKSTYNIRSVPSDYPISDLSPIYCNITKTISVPWYDYYLQSNPNNDRYLSVYLTWDKPKCKKCESSGGKCGLKNYTSLSVRCLRSPTPPYHKALVVPTQVKVHAGEMGKKIAIGVSIGLFLFVVAILAVIRSRKQTNTEEKENILKIEQFLESYKTLKPTRYTYAETKKMTNKFKSKLGQGGYGSVFEGKLTNGIPVAVKILNDSQGSGDEFINEVGTIGRIHHVNVVRLLGFCADGSKRALIYEYMPNESLEKFIFSGKGKNPYFGWEKLQDIAIGIARGIEYLHQGCDQRILHFDIKPHNILLDHNFNPKISDFGLAKLYSKGDSIIPMTAARGTMGYIAPEVYSRNFGKVSYKSDIYSFGMMLLEMVGGRKNIEVKVENTSQVYFPEWIYHRLDRGEDLGIQLDTEEDATIANKLTMVALWCIQWHPVDRPSINYVVQMLEGQIENLMMPPNPFASTTPTTTSTTLPKTPQETELEVILEELE